MKIVFLDFDGVLNDITFIKNFKRKKSTQIELDPDRVHKLTEIIRNTQAKIVLISSWRFNPNIEEYFDNFGLSIYDRVKSLGNRSEEIQEWLWRNPVESYIILDDESSYYTKEQMEHAIITKECYSQEARINKPWFEGLQDKHVKWAIQMLNS